MSKTEEKVLTKEEYEELLGYRQRVVELKNARSDIMDQMQRLKKQMEFAENQFGSVQSSIDSSEDQMNFKFQELMKKYEVSGGQIAIADTEPHVITVS